MENSHTAPALSLAPEISAGLVAVPPWEWDPAAVRHPTEITCELVKLPTGARAAGGQLVPAMRLALPELTAAESGFLVGIHVPLKTYPASLSRTDAPVLGIVRHVGEQQDRLAQIRLPSRARVVGTHTTAWLRLWPPKPALRALPGRLEYTWLSNDAALAAEEEEDTRVGEAGGAI